MAHFWTKNVHSALYVVDVMWRSGLQKFSSHKSRCKQETTCSPYLCSSMNYFWIFFYTTHSSLCLKVLKCHPPPPSLLLHSTFWSCVAAADTPALDVTCFKKWQLSNTDYLRITNNQNLSTFHVCTAATSITADADLADAALVKHVTDWMQVTSPFKVREFVLAVWDVMMCIFIILWSM